MSTRLATLAISSPLSVATLVSLFLALLHTSIRRGRSIDPVRKVFSLQGNISNCFGTKIFICGQNQGTWLGAKLL